MYLSSSLDVASSKSSASIGSIEIIEASDLIASGADRAVIDNREKGWLTQADFNIKPEITHPLAIARIFPDIQKSPEEIHNELILLYGKKKGSFLRL